MKCNQMILVAVIVFSGCKMTDVQSVKVPGQGRYIEQSRSQIAKTNTTQALYRVAPDKHIVNDEKVDGYLSGIMAKLMRQVSYYPGRQPQVVVVIDKSYYAASSPLKVVISTGAIHDAQSEDEIAFLLSHELAHILMAHHQKNLYFNKQRSTVDSAVNIGIMVNKLRDTSYNESGKKFEENLSEQSQSNINKAYLSGLAINRLSRDVINSSLSRDDEAEADLIAIDLMTAAGYSPSVSITSLERLKSARVFTEQQIKIKQNEYRGFVDTVSRDGGSLRETGLGNLGYLIANQSVANFLQNSSQRHPSEELRIADIAEYLKREYRSERRRAYNRQSLANFKSDAIILKRYSDSEYALDALFRSDYEAAYRLADSGLANPANQDGFTNYVMSLVSFLRGSSRRAWPPTPRGSLAHCARRSRRSTSWSTPWC